MAIFRVLGIYLVLIVVALAGCSSGGGDGGDGGGGDDEIVGTGAKTVTGAAQKGPFIIGSTVTVNLLTDTGQPTTNTIVTATVDDLGNFKFDLDNPGLVQVKVNGFHFDEINGGISNAQITLNATYDVSSTDFIVVNVLTHLINNRVLFLIEQGNAPSDAITQAQNELITALDTVFQVSSLPDFTQLSIFNLDGTDPVGNAYLLALSATLYNYANIIVSGDPSLLSSKLAEILNTLAADLEPDGVLDNTTIVDGLADATTSLKPDNIETNLINRSIEALGKALEVPNINLFIDTDRDGEVNSIDTDDDGDGIPDETDPEPYVFNNIPDVESFTISINSEPAVQYNEEEDNTFVSGYRTKLSAHLDNTRVVRGVITPTPTINFLHNENDGSTSTLYMYLPEETAGTYYIDDVTKVRYFSYSKDRLYFNYRAASGSITINEYGNFGNAVIGSYDLTFDCNGNTIQCTANGLLHLSGEFTMIRDETQQFQSVGSVVNPVDLGEFPYHSLYDLNLNTYLYTGSNLNLVSPAAPSYYKFSVNPLNQYTVEIPDSIGGVQLSVYGTPDFSTPLCEALVAPVSCTVTPESGTLYFAISLLNPTALGAWYRLSISPATFLDQGSADNPVDITGQSPYSGQVAQVGSYYRFSVTPGSMYHIGLTTYFGYSYLQVATDSNFTNQLCAPAQIGYGNHCNIAIDDGITELYVRVDPSTSSSGADGYFFTLENWQITLPIYQIQTRPTPVDGGDGCTGVTFYELDGTRVPGLQRNYSYSCSADGFSGNIPLQPGKTYNVEVRDSSSSSPGHADYYALWIGSTAYAGPLEPITPDVTFNEPANDSFEGAVTLGFETLHYDVFPAEDNDYDWFQITIPDNGQTSLSLPSARLDLSFSGNGVQLFDGPFRDYSYDNGYAVRIDPDANILVAGTTHNVDGNYDIILLRYTPDGELDPTFGYDYNSDGINDGYAVYDRGLGVYRSDYAYDLEIDSQNRIVVVGKSDSGTSSDSDLIVLRYNSTGRIDGNFGTGGVVFHDNAAGGNGSDVGKSVAIDNDDNIVIAGYSAGTGIFYDLVVWRYLPSGVLDMTFGGNYDGISGRDGYVIHSNAAGGGGGMGASVALDGQGRIVVAGEARGTGTLSTVVDQDMVVWRFTTDGDLDTTFGGNTGFFVHDGAIQANYLDRANALKITPTGSIIVAGTSYGSTLNSGQVLWKLTENGVLDTTFGSDYDSDNTPDGYVVFDIEGSQVGSSLALDATGNIIIAGSSSTNSLLTGRYTADGQLDSTYGDGGIKKYTNSPTGGIGNQVVLDADGKIVITGSMSSGGTASTDLAIWRLIP